MSQVILNPEVLGVLVKTCQFNPVGKQHLLMIKEGDKVVVRQKSQNQVFVVLETEEIKFDDVEDISIFDFPNFHAFYKELAPETAELKDNKIVLKKGKSRVNYVLSDKELIEKGFFSKITIPSEKAFSFNIGEDELKEIKKMISMVGAESIRFSLEGNTATISLIKENEDNQSSFSKEITLDAEIPEPFVVEVRSEFLNLAPLLPYTLIAYERGEKGHLFNLHFKNDLYSLDLYTNRKLED